VASRRPEITNHAELAERLEQRAEELYSEVLALREQAALYRIEATKEERHVRVVRPQVASLPTRDFNARELEALMDAIEATQPAAMSTIAEHLAVSEGVARARCLRAEELGLVYRTGQRKGTRWSLVTDSGETSEESIKRSAEELVRDSAVKLGAFTVRELADDSGVTYATASRWAKEFTQREWFTVVTVDGRQLYEYVPPEQRTHARRRFTPAEVQVVQRRVSGGQANGVSRVAAARGSAARRLAREVIAAGGTIDTGSSARGGKHLKVRDKDGKYIGTLPKTTWDGSAKAARDQLRKQGLEV
jgi:DNA-binding MarR family transcriptional regulator